VGESVGPDLELSVRELAVAIDDGDPLGVGSRCPLESSVQEEAHLPSQSPRWAAMMFRWISEVPE
jgi:hypothetical protein